MSQTETVRRRRRAVAVIGVLVPLTARLLFFGFDVGSAEIAGGTIPLGAWALFSAAYLATSYQGTRAGRGFYLVEHSLTALPAPDDSAGGTPISTPIPPPPRFQVVAAFASTLLAAVGIDVGLVLGGMVFAGVGLIVVAVLAVLAVPALMFWEQRIRRARGCSQ